MTMRLAHRTKVNLMICLHFSNHVLEMWWASQTIRTHSLYCLGKATKDMILEITSLGCWGQYMVLNTTMKTITVTRTAKKEVSKSGRLSSISYWKVARKFLLI